MCTVWAPRFLLSFSPSPLSLLCPPLFFSFFYPFLSPDHPLFVPRSYLFLSPCSPSPFSSTLPPPPSPQPLRALCLLPFRLFAPLPPNPSAPRPFQPLWLSPPPTSISRRTPGNVPLFFLSFRELEFFGVGGFNGRGVLLVSRRWAFVRSINCCYSDVACKFTGEDLPAILYRLFINLRYWRNFFPENSGSSLLEGLE